MYINTGTYYLNFLFIFILFYAVKDCGHLRKSIGSLQKDVLFLPYSELFISTKGIVPYPGYCNRDSYLCPGTKLFVHFMDSAWFQEVE